MYTGYYAFLGSEIMKYKFKYMLALVIALFAGCNYAHADANEQVCYYKTDKFMAKLTVKTGYDAALLHTFEQYTDITINKVGISAVDNAEDVRIDIQHPFHLLNLILLMLIKMVNALHI